MIGAIGGVLGIVAAFLAVKVVREIQRQQVESSKLIPTQPVFNAPPAPPEFQQPGTLAQLLNFNWLGLKLPSPIGFYQYLVGNRQSAIMMAHR